MLAVIKIKKIVTLDMYTKTLKMITMKSINAILFVGMTLLSVSAFSQVIDNPKASLTLKIKSESGTNGSQVVYNPIKKIYYSIIAGNSSYPLEVFDVDGNNIYQTNTGSDMRGIWWNPKTKTLEGNTYDDSGIISFALDDKGFPSLGNKVIFEGGSHQPNSHSVGTYDVKKKSIFYYEEGQAVYYKRSTGKESMKVTLNVPNKKSISDNSVIYTGKKKMEIGILDYDADKVYLYSRKTGQMTKTINLPQGVSQASSFRFSYANGYVFIYNTRDRAWSGYKVVQ